MEEKKREIIIIPKNIIMKSAELQVHKKKTVKHVISITFFVCLLHKPSFGFENMVDKTSSSGV